LGRITGINSGYHPREFFKELYKAISHGRVWRGEIRNRAKGGGIYWVDTTIVPSVDDDGHVRGYVAIRADITERKQAEEEILLLNADLEQRVTERTSQLQSVIRELEAFSYSVSHDLRTPLRTLDGFSQALIEDCREKLDADDLDNLQRIRKASQRMGHLIDDLLNLSRLTRVEMTREAVDLGKIAGEVVEELRASEPLRVTEVIIADSLVADADPRLARIVLTNLFANAWKFTSKRADARIEFGCADQGGERTFFVRDNGVGFDMVHAGKLFGAFQRLHAMNEFPGTGIGLATVSRIMNRHGGRAWAEGAVGAGATFHFTFLAKP
jgi:light-regulated signal transduction histidine kinase (bacteriophytochrome)